MACGHVTPIFASVFTWPLLSCLSLGHLSPDPGPTRTIRDNPISRSFTQLPLGRPFSDSGHMPRRQGRGHGRIFWGRLLSTHYGGFYPVQIRMKTLFSSIKTLGTPVPGVADAGSVSTESMAGSGPGSLGGAGGRSGPTAQGTSRYGPEASAWGKTGLGRAWATRRHPTFFCGGFDVCMMDGPR